MDFAGIITAVGAVAAASAVFAQVEAVRRWQERTRRTLEEAREPTVENALKQGDLKGLGAFFFDTLGQLPLAEYTEDTEARKLVSQAVHNVENFVDPDRFSAWDDISTLARDDTQRIEFDIARGDFWGGLTRLRRRIELSLRELARKVGIEAEQMGAGQLLQRLSREEIMPSEAAHALRQALQICNRGVHGEPVTGEEVEQALVLAAQGLDAMDVT